MASNHTQHYGLNQWVLEDSVVMEDFNEDNRKIDAALAAAPRVVTGSYVGTGTFGKETPNTLTFDFAPKAVYVRLGYVSLYGTGGRFLCLQGIFVDLLDTSGTKRHYTLDGNTLSWYVDGVYASDAWQLNEANNTYYYIAIG